MALNYYFVKENVNIPGGVCRMRHSLTTAPRLRVLPAIAHEYSLSIIPDLDIERSSRDGRHLLREYLRSASFRSVEYGAFDSLRQHFHHQTDGQPQCPGKMESKGQSDLLMSLTV